MIFIVLFIVLLLTLSAENVWPFCIMIGIVLLTAAFIWRSPVKHIHLEDRQPLASIGDTTILSGRVGGSVFLVSGNIGESPGFLYYVKLPNGSYQLRKTTRQVQISEKTDEAPHVYSDCFYDKREWRFAEWLMSFNINHACSLEPNIFVVPPGSVRQEFNLDVAK